jgi:hypothetical protein
MYLSSAVASGVAMFLAARRAGLDRSEKAAEAPPNSPVKTAH